MNRDEAAILHNTALRFRGRRGLEIGSWLGWSTCHIAMAGVVLDAVDPELANPVVRQSVESSLSMAGIRGLVNLVASASPAAVPRLAGGRKWSFFFIDGDHESPAPTLDAQACAAHATDDALILFHDAAAPAVAAALDWLRDAGWQTALYQTMQILGVAWRGQIEPLHHQPDPSVEWTLPRHVANHPVRELAGP
ncbi:MAG: class I SAM-dependent methyltransferase [Pirellulales bacterium]